MDEYKSKEELSDRKIQDDGITPATGHKLDTLSKVKEFIPDAYMKYATMEGEDESIIVMKTNVFFQIDGQEYKVYYGSGKFSIDIDTSEFGYIDSKLEREIKSGLNPPQTMEKLSEEGIREWIDFEKEYYRELKSIVKNEKSLSFTPLQVNDDFKKMKL